jgi:hypothetical protein
MAPAPLALGAEPEELEAMFYVRVAIMAGEGGLDLRENTVVEFHNPIALLAEKVVMMMAPGVFIGDFEPGQAIAKVDAVDQTHALEEGHGTVDRGEIATSLANGFSNLLWSGRALQSHQRIKDNLTRLSHASCLAP